MSKEMTRYLELVNEGSIQAYNKKKMIEFLRENFDNLTQLIPEAESEEDMLNQAFHFFGILADQDYEIRKTSVIKMYMLIFRFSVEKLQ